MKKKLKALMKSQKERGFGKETSGVLKGKGIDISTSSHGSNEVM